MAMVFKSKKEISELTKKDLLHPGPGDYIPQTISKKNFNRKNITENKSIKNKNINFQTQTFNTPGPEYYFKNENNNKTRNRKNDLLFNKVTTLRKTYEDDIINKKNTNSFEKLGFNIKSIRFNKSKEDINKHPGPGQYFPDMNKFYKKHFINKIREKYKLRRLNRNKTKSNLIPSIPSREQQYGYNILENGELEHKKPPNFNSTFTQCVNKNSDLFKISQKWSLSKYSKGTRSLISTNFSENSKFMNNSSNLLSTITANKFYIDENKNVKELSAYNISSNSLGSFSNSVYFNGFKKNNSAFDIIKKIKIKDNNFKRVPLSFTYNNFFNGKKKNKNKEMIRLSFKLNDNPGPGHYIDGFKNSSFYFKSVPENSQFFGSSAKRFNYKNEIKKEKTSNIEIEKEEFKPKKYKESLVPFLTSDERFKISIDKALYPSPNDYSPDKIKKVKSFSNFDKFGSGYSRFHKKLEDKVNSEYPGPGMYNPQKIKSHINTRKMVKTKDFHNEIFIYKNDLNYDINTIQYENDKKSSSINLNISAFSRTIPQIKKSNSDNNLNSSPGFYYKDKEKEIKQIIAPFNSSANKNIILPLTYNNRNGPGQYKKDSYFDWNKKSFNINYI